MVVQLKNKNRNTIQPGLRVVFFLLSPSLSKDRNAFKYTPADLHSPLTKRMVGRRSIPIGMARIALGWTVKLPGSNFLLKETQSWCVQNDAFLRPLPKHFRPSYQITGSGSSFTLRGPTKKRSGFLLGDWVGDLNESIPWVRKETLKSNQKPLFWVSFCWNPPSNKYSIGSPVYWSIHNWVGFGVGFMQVKTCEDMYIGTYTSPIEHLGIVAKET